MTKRGKEQREWLINFRAIWVVLMVELSRCIIFTIVNNILMMVMWLLHSSDNPSVGAAATKLQKIL